MTDAPYLVALAMVEQEGLRRLPLTGKSQPAAALEAGDPGQDGQTLALELLLRLWQRSDDGALKRAAGDASLLLVELPLEGMSQQLPLLKANWISGGDTGAFHGQLKQLITRGWTISITKYARVSFSPWS